MKENTVSLLQVKTSLFLNFIDFWFIFEQINCFLAFEDVKDGIFIDKSGHFSFLQLAVPEVVKSFNVFVSIVAKTMKLGTFITFLTDVIQMIFSAKANRIFDLHFLPTILTRCLVRVATFTLPLVYLFLARHFFFLFSHPPSWLYWLLSSWRHWLFSACLMFLLLIAVELEFVASTPSILEKLLWIYLLKNLLKHFVGMMVNGLMCIYFVAHIFLL